MTPERKVKAKINEALKGLQKEGIPVYWFPVQSSGYGRAGIPDIVGHVNGVFFAVEAKAGTQLTPLQVNEIKTIQGSNGVAMVVGGDYAKIETMVECLRNMYQISKNTERMFATVRKIVAAKKGAPK